MTVQGDIRAISRAGELALLRRRPDGLNVLARMPLGGGAPREVLEDVSDADWSPNGEELAVVRNEGGRQRLEYPIGRLLTSRRDG